jgi:molybdopterin adenylyltransferase
MAWKTAILTASDKGARGEREDTSAQVIRELVEEELGGEIVEYRIVPDEQDEIIAALIELTDYFQADLVLTTGGTDLAIRDVTPEATRRVIEREVPGTIGSDAQHSDAEEPCGDVVPWNLRHSRTHVDCQLAGNP